MRITRKELQEYIKAVIQEYTGTGDMASTGLTSDDGNNVTSQRSRWDDEYDDPFDSEGNWYSQKKGNVESIILTKRKNYYINIKK